MQTHDKVVPFKADHINELTIGDRQKVVFQIPHLFKIYEELNNSYTFMDEGKPFCCGGVVTFWHGLGELWFVISDDLDIPKKSICSTVKQYIDNMMDGDFRRLQATIKIDDEKAIRFVEWLGFKREGQLAKYGIDGDDYYLYSRVL